MKLLEPVVIFVGTMTLIAAIGAALPAAHAQGAPPPKGLFAEASVTADGATVRRIVDPQNGIACYLTTTPWDFSGTVGGNGRHATIYCLHLLAVNP